VVTRPASSFGGGLARQQFSRKVFPQLFVGRRVGDIDPAIKRILGIQIDLLVA
jgi:hypothetical protein